MHILNNSFCTPHALSPKKGQQLLDFLLILRILPRDAIHSAVLDIINLTVRLSVRPSVTLVNCAHTDRTTITISSPHGRPMILVF